MEQVNTLNSPVCTDQGCDVLCGYLLDLQHGVRTKGKQASEECNMVSAYLIPKQRTRLMLWR
eukprot:9488-Heterococcus_DN1.PRE.3